jgi:glycosyltransferase involved in cell wall biosynthesis
VRETLRHLDLVFYQSGELKELAAKLLNTGTEALSRDRHVVLARGVSAPKTLPGTDARRVVRGNLGLSDGQIVILYLGRISRQKGLFDLVDWFAQWGRACPDLVLLLVGSRPGHDATPELQIRLETTALKERIRIVPGCHPDKVWDYFGAADIFAFPSFREGMPNSLLEAMLSCLPCVAFGIPCVQEILRFGKGLVEVPPYDFSKFGAALLSLAADPSLMREIGERGRTIVREHFSIDESTCSVVGHLSSLCSRVPSARPPRGG